MKTRQVSSAPLAGSPLSSRSTSSSSGLSFEGIPDEVTRLSEEKSKNLKGGDETVWKEEIRKRMEDELNARVREALETPPLERAERQRLTNQQQQQNSRSHLEKLNSHLLFELNDKNHAYLKARKWRALQAKRQMQNLMRMNYTLTPAPTSTIDVIFKDKLSKSNQDEFPGVFGLQTFSEGIKDRNSLDKYPSLKQIHRQFYTKEGFLTALDAGHFPDGSKFDCNENGAYKDRFGVLRDQHGPFWPGEWGPLFPTPRFQWFTDVPEEPLFTSAHNQQFTKTFDNQQTPYTSKWRGVLIVYDSERSSRDHSPQPVPEGCCPNLVFESRFESGNLRQARRVGQCEYELVLKTDLYTNRHTQWYYFRVQNAVPGVVYKFRIVNLLKKDSLYNYGMRPLLYSENDAKNKSQGWIRAGHHISYSRNIMHLHCPLLMRGIPYYELEWQMEFPNAEDTYYLAHCYPYTFTDLKEDLDAMLNSPERRQWIKREVLCETRAGNSCFLVTCTNFDTSREEQIKKKVVVVTARVHPGESQASWMMKGLLDYITSSDHTAHELRNRFIFKVVPMLNPDGVIVGNYRCSLAARDLNRNYRHPRKESFPTVWFTKSMMEKILERHDILLYCDLHGHSRKHNVFMYGNNTSEVEADDGVGAAQAYLRERLFPWLMSQRSPDKFSFPSCKFQIKRCKESTGRVVMWRQMRVLNSFTLEATFSGTILNRKELRHFNIGDFMEMGRVLSQVVLDYEVAQENKSFKKNSKKKNIWLSKQTEVVLDMTRYITNQVLEQRGMIGARIPNLHSLSNRNGRNSDADSGIDASQDNGSTMDGRLSAMEDGYLPRERSDLGDDFGRKTDKKRKGDSRSHGNLSRREVDTMIDNESLKTMDGCLKILSDLNVREALQESDSSDSDSESEPEMKAAEPKPKKKKRKSKKQRDKEHQERKGGSGGTEKKSEERSKSLTTTSNLEKYKKQTLDSRFVSKYEGRRNGGIPCFSEERSIERAAKRMADMKKRTDDEKQRDMAFFCSDTEMPEATISRLPRRIITLQQDRPMSPPSLRRHIPISLVEGVPTIAETLATIRPRDQFMSQWTREWICNTTFDLSSASNTETFRDMTPSVLPATMPSVRDISSEEASDSDVPSSTTITLAARANPYNQHIEASSNLQLAGIAAQKRHLRSGSVLKTFTRHIPSSSSTPSPFLPHSITPISSEMESTKIEKRSRISRTPGPLSGVTQEAINRVLGTNAHGSPRMGTMDITKISSSVLHREYINVMLERLKKRSPTPV
uniref:Cytosolic carboxypeptidase 2-like isoform X21 n=1 Tax=Crassostrea virginica TaxID=6565 RepID=A0A8B8DW75_CRAVI|nr:cytosolic carboxypeptidase 2-like isoform X21 [Crassostrea virginica]